jgi:DUF4097 and DUF4098 domain-containing protein YvlB
MKEKLKDYLETVFAGSAKTQKNEELKEEILANLCDKYDSFIADGALPDEAYRKTISSIGDLSSLFEDLDKEAHKNETSAHFEEADNHKKVEKKALDIFNAILWPVTVILYFIISFATGAWYITWIIFIMATVASRIIETVYGPSEAKLKKDKEEENEQEEERKKKEKKPKFLSVFSAILWPLTVLLYLAISFSTGAWHITWILFITSALTEGIVEAIYTLAKGTEKTVSNVVKLSICSVILVVLLLILPFASIRSNGIFSFNVSSYDASDYIAGNTEISSPVKDLNINWVSGNLTVKYHDNDTVIIQESSADTITDKDRLMWKLSGNELYIQEFKPRFFSSNNVTKDLVVYLPRSTALDELAIEVVSSRICLEDIKTHDTDITTVNGTLNAKACTFAELDIDNVSASITLDGCASNSTSIDTVSGDLLLKLTGTPKELSVDAVSGNVTLYVPSDISGFEVDEDSLSASVTTEGFSVTFNDGNMIYGNGAFGISFDAVSGDLEVIAY